MTPSVEEGGPLDQALAFCEALRRQANAVLVAPGRRHWEIFVRLCREADARGNRVSDADVAALAIESGSEWITTDRDCARSRDCVGGTPRARPAGASRGST